MGCSANAGGAVADLARTILGVLDELGNRADGQRWIDDENERRFHVMRDRHEVGERIEWPLLEQCRSDCHHRAGRDRERIAIRRALRDGLPGDDAGAARAVLDDDGLAEALREFLAVEAHGGIHPGAGSERHDDGDGAGRIVFGVRLPKRLRRKHQGESSGKAARERA